MFSLGYAAAVGERRDLLTNGEREELRTLRGEVRELRRANEILKAASVFFAKEVRPALEVVE